jgi:tRNA(Ile)-lysidine synthase
MFTPQGLLERLAPCRDAPTWWLGLSGGMDSMVLLEALVQLRSGHPLPPLHAVHVHHGLNPAADEWVIHCRDECARRDVPLTVVEVSVQAAASIENAAREARYHAFSALLGAGDQLMLAHHLDDQLETLLFRLIRGTGLRGLAGMPAQRPLGAGALQRPLLAWRRDELHPWARTQALSWIEDPANRDPRFARTGLRHEVLPALRRIWPGTDASLIRLAGHVSEAGELLDELAEADLGQAGDGSADPWLAGWPSIALDRLTQLSAARQRNLLRYWLRREGQPLPDARQLDELVVQLGAAGDGQPLLRWGVVRLARSAGRLWLLREDHLHAGTVQPLAITAMTDLIAGNGRLHLVPQSGGLALERGRWEIGYRAGGEQIRLAGRPARSLKQLFQENAVPVWLRSSIPLLYCDGVLVSVAGRWNDPAGCAAPGEPGWQVRWELPGGTK